MAGDYPGHFSPPPKKKVLSMTFSVELFQPHVGTSFSTLLPNEQQIVVTLESLNDSTVANTGYHSFSLYFTTNTSEPLPQGTYALQHPQLPEQLIFLVPIAKAEQGFRYQACFNVPL
jgi:hypothetical protein